MSDRDNEKGTFLQRTIANGVEESHRARRVRQCGQARTMQTCEHETDGDSHRFLDVVRTRGRRPLVHLEYDDDDRCGLEVRLLPGGAERLDRGQPFVGSTPCIEVAL